MSHCKSTLLKLNSGLSFSPRIFKRAMAVLMLITVMRGFKLKQSPSIILLRWKSESSLAMWADNSRSSRFRVTIGPRYKNCSASPIARTGWTVGGITAEWGYPTAMNGRRARAWHRRIMCSYLARIESKSFNGRKAKTQDRDLSACRFVQTANSSTRRINQINSRIKISNTSSQGMPERILLISTMIAIFSALVNMP